MKEKKTIIISKKYISIAFTFLSLAILVLILPFVEITSFLDGSIKVIILLGLSLTVLYLFFTLFNEFINNITEGIISLMSMCLGILLYYSFKALNISIPELLLIGFEQTNVFSLNTILSLISSFSVGFIVSWSIIKKMKNEVVSKRIILFITTLFLFIFQETFISATKEIVNSEAFNSKLLPNLLFVIGIFTYIVFNFKPKNEK